MGETTEVKIALPLPMDVASTLIQIIGTAYPNTQMKTDSGRYLELVIDEDDRFKNKTSKKRILAAKQFIEDEQNAQLTELRNGQPSVSTPEWIAQSVGFMVERLFEETPDAENYFQMDVRNRIPAGSSLSPWRSRSGSRRVRCIAGRWRRTSG